MNGRVGFLSCRRNGKNIDGELPVLEKFLREFVLRFVLIGGGHGGIRSGKPMRMHQAIDVAGIVRKHHRHVAIGAIHGAFRIIESARALAGNAASLPVVVFVEAANPAVAVHRDVEVDFVAGGAEFRGVGAHEGFQERAAVRLGIEAHDKIVELANDRVVTGGELMQFRVFEEKVALTHGAFHFHDAVAHQAA